MLLKLLDNPLTIPLIQYLAKKPQTIPQIIDFFKNQDLETNYSTIFALISELHRFGLVQRIDTSNQTISIDSTKKNTFLAYDTPLGIPLADYISTWESLKNEKEQMDQSILKKWMFALPNNLATKFRSFNEEQIRQTLLKAFIPNNIQ